MGINFTAGEVPRAARVPRKPGTAIGNGSSNEQVGKRASFKFNIRAWRDAVDEADAARAQARRDLDEENAALPGKIRELCRQQGSG